MKNYKGFIDWFENVVQSTAKLTNEEKIKIKAKFNRDHLREFNHIKL